MEEMYYFSSEFDDNEKKILEKKAEHFKNLENLPVEVVKPKKLVYNEDSVCVGYLGEDPDFPYITLKELFSRENIEKYHVDGHVLLSVAKKVLYLMEELWEKKIYAGFLGIDSILVHRDKPQKAVMIAHPEYFQVEEIPSSYPWYPSDSRLFEEEFELFDAESQKKADAKLIYKILTACEKGNGKIPPNSKTQEYSYLFWNILSREWKEYFLALPEKAVDYEELMDMLSQSIQEEKLYMSPEEKRVTEEKKISFAEKESQKISAYSAIVILREAGKSAHDISRYLYLLQEKLDHHPNYSFEQAFIMGDRHPFVREFRKYPQGFRAQLAHGVHSYSFGEVLLMGAEVLEQALEKKEKPGILFILLDGEIKNDAMFQASLEKLEGLKERWNLQLQLIPVKEFKSEGYLKLSELCKK